MKYLAMVAMVLVLAGCAMRGADSKFEPVAETSEYFIYNFNAYGDENDTEKSEARRLKWLDTWVKQIGRNPEKIEVLERNEVVTNAKYGFKRIYYKVKINK